jgi:uncharacterized protein YkwD
MALRRRPENQRTCLRLERLETRELLSGMQPTAMAQLFLEQLNEARADPAAFGAELGLNLSDVAPEPPLAFNPALIQAAIEHSQDMSLQGYFSHVTPQGLDPSLRMTLAGFDWSSWGESIAGGQIYPSTAAALAALIVDAGVPDLGHRLQLLGMTDLFQPQNQVGIGVVQGSAGPLTNYYTIDTAQAASGGTFLSGVIFNDVYNNSQYAVGEGLGGVTITVPGVGSTTTWDSGGYTLLLRPGTYTVTASGGGLAAPISRTITVGAVNYGLNFAVGTETYIWQLYQTVLGREASLPEVAMWLPVLRGPGGRGAVTYGIENSAEARTRLVDSWYVKYLDRQPTADEVQGWVDSLMQGATEESVLTGILSSDEFYNRAASSGIGGSGDANYVEALYQLLLDRPGTSDELAGWLSVLASSGRATVATGFVTSIEYRADVVASYYFSILHRPAFPSAAEIGYWVNYDGNLTDIRIGFEQSNEFADI